MDFPLINIETLILVAVWNQPAIFQGCFKITPAHLHQSPLFLFFRCLYANKNKSDYVDDVFFPDEYDFSHLYYESTLIHSDPENEGWVHAEYILKYALYKTLLKMRSNLKHRFISMDDRAMEAIIKQVEPILQQKGTWEMTDEHIGFAVSMDFNPQEQMGALAVKTLLSLSNLQSAGK